MLNSKDFWGGSTTLSTSSTIDIDRRYRLWLITANIGGLTMKLPPVTQLFLPVGPKIFVIVNHGVNSFNLRDFELTDPYFTSYSLAANRCAIIHSYLNPTFKWIAETRVWDPS